MRGFRKRIGDEPKMTRNHINEKVQYNWDLQNSQIQHYENIRDDVRGEIKQRIMQRDNFSVQFIVSLGTIIAVSFVSGSDYRFALLFLPLVSAYFSLQILYSYSLHDVLVKYLKKEIEPTLTRLLGIDERHEWEKYYAEQDKESGKKYKPGIRRNFFILSLWVTSILPTIYLFFHYYSKHISVFGINILYIIIFSGIFYIFITAYITKTYFKIKR